MKDQCPTTLFFLKLAARFDERLKKIREQEKKTCTVFGKPAGSLCPMNYLRGRVAERTYKKLEKDAAFQEDIRRGVIKNLAIMFADIRGFTRRTASMPPERIVTLLDLIVPEMISIIIGRHHGMVDKLLGDGIMAVFGHAEKADGSEVVRAVHSAIDMQQAAAALHKVLSLAGFEPVQIGVGINCGDVLVCEVGDDRYRESTVIGAPVNLAAKMEDLAGPGEIALPRSALACVEAARPVMLPFFNDGPTAGGEPAVILDWISYLESGQAGEKDWALN